MKTIDIDGFVVEYEIIWPEDTPKSSKVFKDLQQSHKNCLREALLCTKNTSGCFLDTVSITQHWVENDYTASINWKILSIPELRVSEVLNIDEIKELISNNYHYNAMIIFRDSIPHRYQNTVSFKQIQLMIEQWYYGGKFSDTYLVGYYIQKALRDLGVEEHLLEGFLDVK